MLVTFRWHSAANKDAGFQQHDTVCHHTLQAINLTNVLVCAEGASTALHVWLFGEASWQGASCPARAIITNGLSGVVPKLPAMVHIGFGIWHLAFVCCIQCFFRFSLCLPSVPLYFFYQYSIYLLYSTLKRGWYRTSCCDVFTQIEVCRIFLFETKWSHWWGHRGFSALGVSLVPWFVANTTTGIGHLFSFIESAPPKELDSKIASSLHHKVLQLHSNDTCGKSVLIYQYIGQDFIDHPYLPYLPYFLFTFSCFSFRVSRLFSLFVSLHDLAARPGQAISPQERNGSERWYVAFGSQMSWELRSVSDHWLFKMKAQSLLWYFISLYLPSCLINHMCTYGQEENPHERIIDKINTWAIAYAVCSPDVEELSPTASPSKGGVAQRPAEDCMLEGF